MPRSIRTNYMKATTWTPTMRAEFAGTIDEGIVMAFYGLTSTARRQACIAKLQELDARLTARAAELADAK